MVGSNNSMGDCGPASTWLATAVSLELCQTNTFKKKTGEMDLKTVGRNARGCRGIQHYAQNDQGYGPSSAFGTQAHAFVRTQNKKLVNPFFLGKTNRQAI